MSFNKAKEAHEKLMSERKEVSWINKGIALIPNIEVDHDNRQFIYCGKCGEDIDENWTCCGYCGTKIDWSDEE